MAKAKYDWAQIAKEYIEGVYNDKGGLVYPSFRDLNAKYGVSCGALSRKANEGQWALQRERIANKIRSKQQEKRAETLSDEALRFDLSCFNISREGAEKAKRMLAQTEKPGDFAVLTKALKDLQAIAKTAIGDTGNGESAELKIEVTLGED